jgi:N-acyl-D-amino-acid deacylase
MRIAAAASANLWETDMEPQSQPQPETDKADTLIVGARVIDGTGAPAAERDVALRDGRIVAMEGG